MASDSLSHSSRQNQSSISFAERAQRRFLSAAKANDNDSNLGRDTIRMTSARYGQPLSPTINQKLAWLRLPDASRLPVVLLMGAALLALELTNAATTWYALESLMGGVGIYRASFAMLLTFGLASLDAGGLYRLFHPATAGDTNRTFALWSILFAWLLCATTNAVLTWWAVAAAMAGHVTGNVLLSAKQLLDTAPVFLALSLWLMRILLVAGWVQGERG